MYIFEAPEFSKSVYDDTRAAIGWEKSPPAGVLAHAISFRKGDVGAFAFDLWDTKEAAERYYEGHLRPALAAANVPMVEPMAVLELYNFAYGPTAQIYAVPRELTPA